MANPKIQPAMAHTSQYSTRMVVTYKYGSLVIAGIGLVWAVVFAVMGSWWMAAIETAAFATGLAIHLLIRRNHLTFGILAGQAALMVIIIFIGLFLDVPTAEAPRVSHIYLLALAAMGYLNYQREKSRAQMALIVLCLLAFIALASAPLATPFVVPMPDMVRSIGSWANTIMATTILAFCIHAMQAEFVRQDNLSRDLVAALWNEEFDLVYQPQVDLSQTTIGAEALLRWNSPKRGIVSPVEFVPQAEKLGLMVAIGGWVLEKGCCTLVEWGKHPDLRHVSLSINVSASQLMHDDFEAFVHETLAKTGADPQRLILELTESMLVTDMEQVIAKLGRLHDLGITNALDDFGTGFSSLSYLRHLPFQQIKIDKSFVQDSVKSERGASFVKNIVHIGRDLGHTVLAEGVETIEQHALLAHVGSMQFQGYLYGRPMALDDFQQRLENEAKRPAPKLVRAGR